MTTNKNSMDKLKIISSLFEDNKSHYSLLIELSNIGVIEWGSVVLSLNDYVH